MQWRAGVNMATTIMMINDNGTGVARARPFSYCAQAAGCIRVKDESVLTGTTSQLFPAVLPRRWLLLPWHELFRNNSENLAAVKSSSCGAVKRLFFLPNDITPIRWKNRDICELPQSQDLRSLVYHQRVSAAEMGWLLMLFVSWQMSNRRTGRECSVVFQTHIHHQLPN